MVKACAKSSEKLCRTGLKSSGFRYPSSVPRISYQDLVAGTHVSAVQIIADPRGQFRASDSRYSRSVPEMA
eukprot:3549777-Rhodomonas_salina.1